MAGIEMRADLSHLVDALIAGDSDQILAQAREQLQQGEHADVLLGRLALLTARGDADGNPTITLAAAAMLSRLLHTIPQPLEGEVLPHERALPLFMQALLVAAPAVRNGKDKQLTLPAPFFPSELAEGDTVNAAIRKAIDSNDSAMTERLLLGLYGTGADYRTLQVRAYEGIATTFQDAGHPLLFAVRGFQVLDAVEWGTHTPEIVDWLTPHLPIRPQSDEPEWVKAVRSYVADPAHSVASIRTRLAAANDTNALPLHQLILSDADTTQVCQGVYNALIQGNASPRAVGSVIALAAADIMERVSDENRDFFVQAAHGLLFAAASRLVFRQVQDVEVLPLLFTSAAYVNALQKEITLQPNATKTPAPSATQHIVGGGLIAPAQLETLNAQLQNQDFEGALHTARRYLKLGYDGRALFATIALNAARVDATADQGHTLQIVQAASEEFMAWPIHLAETNHEAFLTVALRAAAFGKRHTLVNSL